MADAYYREKPLEDAIIAMLNTVLPDGYTAKGPTDEKVAVGTCIVEVLTPQPGFTSMMGGPSFAEADFQTSCVGRDRDHAREFGGMVRQALTEREWTGPLVNPIFWDHGRVDEIVHNRGFLQTDKGINTWLGDYRASYQATRPSVLPLS